MRSKIRNAYNTVRNFFTRIIQRSSVSKSSNIVESNPAADQLRTIVTKTKEQARDTQITLGNLGTRIQVVIDDADAFLPLVPYIKPDKIEGLAVLWDDVSRQTGFVKSSLDEVFPTTDSVSGSASITTATISGVFSGDINSISPEPSFHAALSHFNQVITRPTLRDEVISLLRIFHLDVASPGKKSPLELFQTAHLAFDTPISQSNPVITSLVPMREAVESVIDELIRRRPYQEATGASHRKKIQSIAAQLKKDATSEVVVQEWVDQWHDISDKDLSASKRNQMTREDWSRKLNRATLFLHSFLIGLDPSKLHK